MRGAATAVAKGRELTRKRNFDGAIAAFDAALELREDLPTALSGRGYARLLRAKGDDLLHARADFEAALAFAAPDDTRFRDAVKHNLQRVAAALDR